MWSLPQPTSSWKTHGRSDPPPGRSPPLPLREGRVSTVTTVICVIEPANHLWWEGLWRDDRDPTTVTLSSRPSLLPSSHKGNGGNYLSRPMTNMTQMTVQSRNSQTD